MPDFRGPQFVSGGWDNLIVNPDQEKALAEVKAVFGAPFKDLRNRRIAFAIYIPLISIYIFGYCYNNLQNPNQLFNFAWFIDSILLSWTNLLILPVLLLVTPWKKKYGSWDLVVEHLAIHLFSPLVWIFGYMGFRFIIKMTEGIINSLTIIMNWLAN